MWESSPSGRKAPFQGPLKFSEYTEKNVVLSRKVILEEEETEAAAALKSYQEQTKDAPKKLGSLGELLKAKMEQIIS